MSAIKEIGTECYAPERVLKELHDQQTKWDLLSQDFYMRFGDMSYSMVKEADILMQFFNNRYDNIIPVIEAWGEAEFGITDNKT